MNKISLVYLLIFGINFSVFSFNDDVTKSIEKPIFYEINKNIKEDEFYKSKDTKISKSRDAEHHNKKEEIRMEKTVQDDKCYNFKITDYYMTDLPEEIEKYTIDICNSYGVPPEIVFAVMWQESRYTIDIMGDNGKAYGLMQIRPEWHQDRMARLNCYDLLDPYQNILVGTDLISELYSKYNDMHLALTYFRHGTVNGDRSYEQLIYNVSYYITGKTSEIVY